MTTVVFVHGTGVRGQSYADSFAALSANLAAIRPNLRVAQCHWGESVGARLLAGGISIPSGDSGRGFDLASECDQRLGLWARLEADPLAELRLLALDQDDIEPLYPPNAVAPGPVPATRISGAVADDNVIAAARAAGLHAVLGPAITFIVDSEPGQAVLHGTVAGVAVNDVLARAIVAEAMVRTDRLLDGELALDGHHRDAVCRALVSAFGESGRGIGRFALDLSLALGVTRPLERRRKAITSSIAALPGDVLLYLVRGEPVRQFIFDVVDEIAAADPDEDIVLLAHSLGGIASLEMLIGRSVPAVKQLITFGSQAPFLYELNALPALEYGKALPDHLPQWTNIFDPRDLLGYAAAGLFPGQVDDRMVDNDAPFPRAHSAYVRGKNFFEVLDEVLM